MREATDDKGEYGQSLMNREKLDRVETGGETQRQKGGESNREEEN